MTTANYIRYIWIFQILGSILDNLVPFWRFCSLVWLYRAYFNGWLLVKEQLEPTSFSRELLVRSTEQTSLFSPDNSFKERESGKCRSKASCQEFEFCSKPKTVHHHLISRFIFSRYAAVVFRGWGFGQDAAGWTVGPRDTYRRCCGGCGDGRWRGRRRFWWWRGLQWVKTTLYEPSSLALCPGGGAYAHPTSPAANHTKEPCSYTSCCTGAPFLYSFTANREIQTGQICNMKGICEFLLCTLQFYFTSCVWCARVKAGAGPDAATGAAPRLLTGRCSVWGRPWCYPSCTAPWSRPAGARRGRSRTKTHLSNTHNST